MLLFNDLRRALAATERAVRAGKARESSLVCCCAALLNHLIGAGEQHRRDGEAERFRGVQIND
jgi:hypothetical protein